MRFLTDKKYEKKLGKLYCFILLINWFFPKPTSEHPCFEKTNCSSSPAHHRHWHKSIRSTFLGSKQHSGQPSRFWWMVCTLRLLWFSKRIRTRRCLSLAPHAPNDDCVHWCPWSGTLRWMWLMFSGWLAFHVCTGYNRCGVHIVAWRPTKTSLANSISVTSFSSKQSWQMLCVCWPNWIGRVGSSTRSALMSRMNTSTASCCPVWNFRSRVRLHSLAEFVFCEKMAKIALRMEDVAGCTSIFRVPVHE